LFVKTIGCPISVQQATATGILVAIYGGESIFHRLGKTKKNVDSAFFLAQLQNKGETKWALKRAFYLPVFF
jgi:hypothetical protein